MKIINKLEDVNMYLEFLCTEQSPYNKEYNSEAEVSVIIYDDYTGDLYKCGIVNGRKGKYIDIHGGFRYYLSEEEIENINKEILENEED